MKKFRLITVLLFILVIALFSTGCKKKKKEEISFPQLVPCTEFNLPEGYSSYAISTTEDNKYAYITAQNPDAVQQQDFMKVYLFTNTDDGWGDPVELDFGGTIFPVVTRVSPDGSKLFFTGVKGEEFVSSGGITSLLPYSADIDGELITNITPIDISVNSDYVTHMVLNVDKDKNILIGSLTDRLAFYYVKPENDGYVVSEIIADSSKIEGMLTFILPIRDKAYVITTNTNSANIYVSDFKDGKLENLTLEKDNLDRELNFLSVNISGDEKLIYIVNSQGIYKISTEAATADLDLIFNADYESIATTTTDPEDKSDDNSDDNQGSNSSDAFDQSNYSLSKRNKSDVSNKQGVYYEIFVRSFADSNGDGIGDFNGVTNKLDYLADLGIDGIWLMPINESPSYHGYDITNYYTVNPDYGTEEDFKNLLEEAHKRHIKIIMDFVINHTSDSHPWFARAKRDENSEFRDYYRWVTADDSIDYSPSDRSPWNSTVWHRSGNAYYYGIFWSGMPDLNYNNPMVREEIKDAAAKWLEFGVDGFRLDAAMHIYGDNEFKQQEDQLASNLQWWNEFALHCESINPDVYLVGEAWQANEVLAEYVQPFDTKFNFSFTSDMMNAVVNEKAVSSDGSSLAASLQKILDEYSKIDENYLDGIFGTNHDQDRIMSRLNNIDKAKLVANIYLTLPGNPFIYYGEEIGMYGQKPDERIREPFKWTVDGSGLDTTWESASSNSKTIALEEQVNDPNSLYNHYKTIIALRKSNKTLTSGKYYGIVFDNQALLGYLREEGNEKVYVIHNLSKDTVQDNIEDLRNGKVLFASEGATLKEDKVTLTGYSTIVIQK